MQTVTRGFAHAFFDKALSGTATQPLDIVDAPIDVYLYGYPIEGNQSR